MKWFSHPLFRSPWFYAVLLFVLAVLLTNLAGTGLYAAHEARNGFIARNMLRTGNWLDMQVPFGEVYEKPILTYWLTAISGTVLGLAGNPASSPVELAVRLPQMFAALLTVLFAGLLGGRIYGRNTGLLTTVVLSSMLLFNTQARIARIDIMLAFSCMMAMYFFYIGFLEKRKCNHWIYGFYLALALGMMFKGPLVVLLCAMTIAVMALYFRDWKLPFRFRPLTGTLVFLLFGCSWYVFESLRTDGAFFREFILSQNINRFTGVGSTFRGGERMPIYYYFQYLMVGALPWSIPALIALAVKWKPIVKRTIRPDSVFLLAWFVTGFLFFSFSALKRSAYLLPLYPAVAILTARSIVYFCEHCGNISKHWRILWAALTVFFLTVYALNAAGLFHKLGEAVVAREIKFISKSDGVSMLFFSDLATSAGFWGLAGLLVLLGILLAFQLLMEKGHTYTVLATFAVGLGAVMVYYHAVLDPVLDRDKSLREFAFETAKQIAPGEPFWYANGGNNELIFYLDRPYVMGSADGHENCNYAFCGDIKRTGQKPPAESGWELAARTERSHERQTSFYRRVPPILNPAPAKSDGNL